MRTIELSKEDMVTIRVALMFASVEDAKMFREGYESLWERLRRIDDAVLVTANKKSA